MINTRMKCHFNTAINHFYSNILTYDVKDWVFIEKKPFLLYPYYIKYFYNLSFKEFLSVCKEAIILTKGILDSVYLPDML